MVTDKYAFLMALALASTAVPAAGVEFGIMWLDSAGHAVLVTAKPLDGGQVVDFQHPDDQGRVVCCKRLSTQDFVRTYGSGAVATNEVIGEGVVLYEARVPKRRAGSPLVGGAAIGQGLTTRQIHGLLVAKAKRGSQAQVRTCVSQEGVHLIQKVDGIEKDAPLLVFGL